MRQDRHRYGISRPFLSMRSSALVTGAFLLLGCLLAGCGSPEGGDIRIYRLDPNVGPTTGDQPVRIHGDGFRTDVGYTVYFGPKRAPRVTIVDDSTMFVVTPPYDEATTVDLVIMADDGPAWKVHQAYTYQQVGGNVIEHLGESKKKGKLVY